MSRRGMKGAEEKGKKREPRLHGDEEGERSVERRLTRKREIEATEVGEGQKRATRGEQRREEKENSTRYRNGSR